MTVRYADTSALVRAYFADEVRHEERRQLLLQGAEPVVTSELARLELTSAAAAAARAGRIGAVTPLLDRFDADCGDRGPLALIRLIPERTFDEARRLLVSHRLRSLDALHLATALILRTTLTDDDIEHDLVFVSEDIDQSRAARAEGFEVA